jgi:putative addiction module component (TIGR02574 family)
MSTNLDLSTLTVQALALPPEQRAELAQKLWQSVEGRLEEEDEEFFQELERRNAEMDAGTVRTYTHEEVMREARKIIGQ